MFYDPGSKLSFSHPFSNWTFLGGTRNSKFVFRIDNANLWTRWLWDLCRYQVAFQLSWQFRVMTASFRDVSHVTKKITSLRDVAKFRDVKRTKSFADVIRRFRDIILFHENLYDGLPTFCGRCRMSWTRNRKKMLNKSKWCHESV